MGFLEKRLIDDLCRCKPNREITKKEAYEVFKRFRLKSADFNPLMREFSAAGICRLETKKKIGINIKILKEL